MANPWDVSGAWTPANAQELRDFSRANNWSEDFDRFSDAQVDAWIRGGHWDANARRFTSEKTDQQGNALQGFVDKPVDTPEGWEAWGENMARRSGSGSGGPGGGGSGGGFGAWGGSSGGGGGVWDLQKFEAPSFESVLQDPGYKFGLEQGLQAIQNSAAAKGNLFTGNTGQNIVQFGNDYATSKYNDAFNRSLQAWQANEQPWALGQQMDLSRWQTGQNAELQKYLQREQNIYGLMSAPPQFFGGGGF